VALNKLEQSTIPIIQGTIKTSLHSVVVCQIKICKKSNIFRRYKIYCIFVGGHGNIIQAQ